jgi:plasmid stabilization system protein ParE
MSATSFSFHPAAIEEAISATRWYRERSRLAATNFVAELNEAIGRILKAPHRWPLSSRGTRKLKLPCFPFLVIYREVDGSVLVLAVAHGSRRPGYWKSRF